MSDELTRRQRLEWDRDLLTASLSSAEPGQVAALSRELRAVLSEIESLPSESKQATVDQLKERRAQRRAETADRARTAER